jgi:hypothetical protein
VLQKTLPVGPTGAGAGLCRKGALQQPHSDNSLPQQGATIRPLSSTPNGFMAQPLPLPTPCRHLTRWGGRGASALAGGFGGGGEQPPPKKS